MSVLVDRSVPRTLFSMAYPMLAGTFAMNAYNLVDTWFIAKLGTLPLAAMGFIFPVVMLVTCIAGGIGTGITTLVSHAIGRQDHPDATRFVTHGLILVISVTIIISVFGRLLMVPTFSQLGADNEILDLIAEYMNIWYFGAVFMAMPMLGNGILISVGDSKAASWFMILGTVINTILDPIMIFGFFGCPVMGIRGAALATVIAQSISTVCLLYLLCRKHHLLSWVAGRFNVFFKTLCQITHFAIPSILSMILMPISNSIITKILSFFGNEAVAACGVASRIESFAFMIPMAVGMSLTPFVSQNFGAGCMNRVREAQRITKWFALGYGGFIALVFFFSSSLMASVFSDDPKVAVILVHYIQIISFGYGMMEVHRYCGFFLTGMQKPVSTTILNAIRIIVLLIPLSYLGAHFWGITGVFSCRLISDIISGSIGLVWVSQIIHTTITPVKGISLLCPKKL